MSIISALIDLFPSFIPGSRLVDGGECLQLAQLICSAKTGYTALAGGGQTGATQLTATLNEVPNVASDNDSVMLPLAIPGRWVVVNNTSGHSLQVFGQPINPNNAGAGDTIAPNNSVTQAATGTGVAQATAVMAIYVCTTIGQWKQGSMA